MVKQSLCSQVKGVLADHIFSMPYTNSKLSDFTKRLNNVRISKTKAYWGDNCPNKTSQDQENI